MKKRVRRGDPARERQWRATLRDWSESRLSVRAYCRQEGIKESAFFFWRRELARRDKQVRGSRIPPRRARGQPVAVACKDPHQEARFLPVEVIGEADRPVDGRIEIVGDRGRVIRVPPRFDRQTLADVLAVLEARPC